MRALEINPWDVKELFQTADEDKANELLREGWILYDVTRGNLKYMFLLARI
ncbi:hypothetical protein [Paenibacillus sp. PL2-23]|uniref:hypothetical protein n=1 Tax=Paenibacillus sp. PL2-23 TaxID=2100729 RepID=UPI0030FA0343